MASSSSGNPTPAAFRVLTQAEIAANTNASKAVRAEMSSTEWERWVETGKAAEAASHALHEDPVVVGELRGGPTQSYTEPDLIRAVDRLAELISHADNTLNVLINRPQQVGPPTGADLNHQLHQTLSKIVNDLTVTQMSHDRQLRELSQKAASCDRELEKRIEALEGKLARTATDENLFSRVAALEAKLSAHGILGHTTGKRIEALETNLEALQKHTRMGNVIIIPK